MTTQDETKYGASIARIKAALANADPSIAAQFVEGVAMSDYNSSSIPGLWPIGGTWYSRINSTGEVLEITVKVLNLEDWRNMPESSDPTWRSMVFGDVAIAVKVLL